MFRYNASVSLLLFMIITNCATAQTFTVLHSFSGGGDGAQPYSTLTTDFAGNLYGTTYKGAAGYGTVFKLKHAGSGWGLSTLYTFQGGSDGAYPISGVAFGPSNILYGTTNGGGQNGQGTVFSIRPSVNVCVAVSCPWTHAVLHRFTGGSDGAYPEYGNLLFDSQGSIYGTTNAGGTDNVGTVYQLTQSGGNWTEGVLYSFGQGAYRPFSRVILDSFGNLYGTASEGGADGNGAVYELVKSGSTWSYNELHAFTGINGDGSTPEGDLIFDAAGNLYGTTAIGGPQSGGSAFELSPIGSGWSINVLQYLSGLPGPLAGLTMDAVGNLYGTGFTGGTHGCGYVFKLTFSGGVWNYSTLYDFTGGADGGNPAGGVIIDTNGNIFGTSSSSFGVCPVGNGAVWEITP